MIDPFRFVRCPALHFGAGALASLDSLLDPLGGPVLLVTGAASLKDSGHLDRVLHLLKNPHHYIVHGEPSPEQVDEAVARYRTLNISAVVGIGGGSAVDAGKAISAMLAHEGSVEEYLEGVGDPGKLHGGKVPYIAVPTTAGTGSEATKNAVLSRVGEGGFKKSLRHDSFVPDAAVVDPELMLLCPPSVTAACGMDALTQLLEAYVSTKATPLTDAWALKGLECLGRSLVNACNEGGGEARGDMALAAYLSGAVLANAGLGVVHGLASVVGGAFPAPHGVICGTLVGAATEATIRKLDARHPAWGKYAKVGALLTGVEAPESLVEQLNRWIDTLGVPRLGEYGVTVADVDRIAGATGNKNNPVPLTAEEIRQVVLARI